MSQQSGGQGPAPSKAPVGPRVQLFGQPKPPADDPNIIGVRKFVNQEPWLSFDQSGLPKVDGVKCTVYLESGTTGRGAFGDGNLLITAYTVEKGADKTDRLRKVYTWEFTPEATIPWRSIEPTRLGHGYGMRLRWEGIDLTGREIELAFQFQRRDGQFVSSRPIRLQVPKQGSRVVESDVGPGIDPSGNSSSPAGNTAVGRRESAGAGR